MCFSVNVNLIKEELENRYEATLIDYDKYRPSYYYHAFAIPEMPVICSADPSKLEIHKWGLIPSVTKGQNEANNIRVKTFNARAESLDQKKTFSSAFQKKRCIVPVMGFYEWQHLGREKIPWYIYYEGNQIMSLAGLYDQWHDTNTGEILKTFTIITTNANELMAEIHNSAKRMPAILNRSNEEKWIDPSTSSEELRKILNPVPSEVLRAHTISHLVNDRNADRNTPEVIMPYKYHTQNLLF